MSNNISDGKMFAYMDRVIGDHRPITADVFLTNYCNNKCPYCTYGRWELDPGARYMKYEDFVKYAERLSELGVQGIILSGGGEPTLDKDFNAITAWLEATNRHYGINTNFNELKFFSPDYLKVSLDGWDEESYKAHRGVCHYQQVRENILAYDRWRKIHSTKTALGIQAILNTVEEVYKFYEANKDLPVDYISIRPIESTLGKYYRDLQYAKDTNGYRPEELRQAIRYLMDLDSRVIYNFKWDLIDHIESECIGQWAEIALNEKGEVIYCCHKPYEIVGHIMDPDILEKKANAITNMAMCDVPCRLSAPNIEIRKMLEPKKDIFFI